MRSRALVMRAGVLGMRAGRNVMRTGALVMPVGGGAAFLGLRGVILSNAAAAGAQSAESTQPARSV